MRQHTLSTGLAALTLWAAANASAAVIIRDPSFFDSKPHTFLDFETLPDGTTLADLTDGTGAFISRDAYANTGVRFGFTPIWGRANMLDPMEEAYSQALTDGGSPEHMLARMGAFLFDVPVRSVGVFLMLHSSQPATESWALFRYFDSAGQLIDSHIFDEDAFLGSVSFVDAGGVTNYVHYGYFGAASDSEIANLSITSPFDSILRIDNLHFSAVPAPGAGAALLLAGALTLRRRR